MFGIEEILNTLVVLWAVVDPIGTIPVFLAVTKGHSAPEKIRIARYASFVAFGILLFFIVVGEMLLKSVGVSLAAFQISGGVILFLFAIDMVFGHSKPEGELELIKDGKETAIFPLAIPSIAGPGAILAVVLLTDNSRHSLVNQGLTVAALAVVLIVNYILMCLSNKVHHKIGNSGAIIISKVTGMILASMAASYILIGIKDFFKL